MRSPFVLVVVLALAAACGAAPPPNPRLTLRYEKGLDATDLNFLMQRAGPGPVAIVDLGRTAWVSHHLAVVRDAETPHYHRFHDLTVSMLRGEGVLDLEGKRIVMKAGDIAHIHRGTRHFFRNTGKGPAATFVVFSPPYDGRDNVKADDTPAPEEPPEPPKKSWWPFGRSGKSKVEEAPAKTEEVPSP